MSPKISTIEFKLPIIYDFLNTKHNRICEQLTSIFLFILASVIAYCFLYLQSFKFLTIIDISFYSSKSPYYLVT